MSKSVVNRSVVTMLIVILLAVVFWLASKPDSAPQDIPEMVRFNPQEIFSIRVKQEGMDAIFLSRSDETWHLAEKETIDDEPPQLADPDAVQHLLDDLATMKIIRVVTRNPKYYKKLRVYSEKNSSGSTQVTLKGEDGNTLLNLFIGKQGADLISTYLRIAGSVEVLAVNKVLLWQVRRSYQDWKAPIPVEVEPAADPHESAEQAQHD